MATFQASCAKILRPRNLLRATPSESVTIRNNRGAAFRLLDNRHGD
ncbi:hypothetical protein BcepF1.011 [Burkholderia phage BcepF1]|uniref:Uncharacterized protein n=1 Tax=Burkholderia phage BcepF1 TaxID=2886897 RepID=A1YZR5_9CAUD|nr:hypothetical protein BcepF1.011 [Burkholderia phage BcepF1]ABL96742.1 hypothetical protein BcepF1.011 [Burkholderia phage BcepF1]